MKKSLFSLILAAAVAVFTACGDSNDAEGWQKLPTTPVTGADATLTVNGQPAQGSVQLVPASETQGTLTLSDLLPGYARIEMEVSLSEQADGSFDFSGEKTLTAAPAMMTKAVAAGPAIFNLSVRGNLTAAGKLTLDAQSALTPEAQGGLSGTWRLLPAAEADPTTGMPTLTPIFLVWTPIDATKPNLQQGSMIVNLFGSMVLFDVLDSVTLHPDGNITARYWPEIGMGGTDDNGNFVASHDEWLESPKNNLAFWYVKNDRFYIVPNIDEILRQTAGDNDGAGEQPIDLAQLIGQLKAFGVDTETLQAALKEWMVTGIPLRYTKQGNSLKLFVDKQMVTPFMEALLPALPKLDEMLAPILADETNETGALIKMAFGMLGIEKLADIQTIWNTNTADFELSINLVSGASQPAPAGAKSRVKALRTQKAADRAAFERLLDGKFGALK